MVFMGNYHWVLEATRGVGTSVIIGLTKTSTLWVSGIFGLSSLDKILCCYLLVLSAEVTYPFCSKECCYQRKGSNAQNKWAQSILTFMARTTSTLLNGLRFTLRKALLSYMLTLTLRLQEYHISFLQALHQRYNLQTICYMGDPSP